MVVVVVGGGVGWWWCRGGGDVVMFRRRSCGGMVVVLLIMVGSGAAVLCRVVVNRVVSRIGVGRMTGDVVLVTTLRSMFRLPLCRIRVVCRMVLMGLMVLMVLVVIMVFGRMMLRSACRRTFVLHERLFPGPSASRSSAGVVVVFRRLGRGCWRGAGHVGDALDARPEEEGSLAKVGRENDLDKDAGPVVRRRRQRLQRRVASQLSVCEGCDGDRALGEVWQHAAALTAPLLTPARRLGVDKRAPDAVRLAGPLRERRHVQHARTHQL
jgi:hypothetical protein